MSSVPALRFRYNAVMRTKEAPPALPVALREKVLGLVLNDPTMHAAFSLYACGTVSWEEAMTMAAVALAEQNARLIGKAVEDARWACVSPISPTEPRAA